jgi:hypothetical protein
MYKKKEKKKKKKRKKIRRRRDSILGHLDQKSVALPTARARRAWLKVTDNQISK